MSDKELIETIKKIKVNCRKKYQCNDCSLLMNDERCQIALLVERLARVPSRWNIEEIEEVICK